MHINHRQKGGKEGGDHTPAAELVAHNCQRGVGGRRMCRKNEPICQGQDGHCRLLLLFTMTVQYSNLIKKIDLVFVKS